MQKFKKGDRVVDLDFYSPEVPADCYTSIVHFVDNKNCLYEVYRYREEDIYVEPFGTTVLVLESVFNSPVYQLLKDGK